MKKTFLSNTGRSMGQTAARLHAGLGCALLLFLLSLIANKGNAQSASPYCDYTVDNTFGYAYDNVSGNNFAITNMSVTGSGVTAHTDLVGGTSDAAKPSASFNQGVLLSDGATVTQGLAPTFTVSNPSGAYACIYRIYVDWDNNNQFTDAQDLVYTSGTITGSVHTFSKSTFVIPITATLTSTNTVGAHRMRVVCEYQGETQRGSCGATGSPGAQGDAKDFTLTVNAASPCSGMPSAGTATPVLVSICANSSTVINLSGASVGFGGIAFQWQQSSTGTTGSFADVTGGAGATNASYTTPSLANVTGSALNYYYRCIVTCSNSSLSDTSADATVSVQPAATVTATASLYTVTSGVSTTLSATGAATYKWSPPNGLSATTGSSVTATPSVTTTYTATGTTATGCTATDTAKITVNSVVYPYCNYQVLDWFGLYGYDNMLGNTFYVQSFSINGTTPLNFTGGTTDAGHPFVGYNQGDFTSFGATVNQANQYNFTVTRPAGTYGCQIRIYVDWNNNNDFTDAGENILTSANLSGSGTTFTGSYTIPITAPTGGNNTTGAHRMRVVCEWNDEIQRGACGLGGDNGAQGDAKDFTLTVAGATPCSGTPSVGSAVAVSSALCNNGSTAINLSGLTLGLSGITYQWQSSPTGLGGSFTNVTGGIGATSSSYTTPSLVNATGSPVNYYYQCVLTCTNSGMSATSGDATVTVQPVVTIVATAADSTINAGSSTTLSATGALTYTWTPASSLSASTGASVTATPGYTTIYTATGTTTAGCKGADTAKVVVIQPFNPYCDFQVLNFFGLYGYDNIYGNNFIITGVAVNGTTPLNFTGGTSDAAHPAVGYNQGIFTSQSATVRESNTYTWTITMPAGSYARIVRVYVDWNDNNSFADAGDNIITTGVIPGSVTTTGALSYTLSPTAPRGTHRMRIVCEWNGETQRGSCGLGGTNGAQGDAKDFSLVVKDINGNRSEGQDIGSANDQADNNLLMSIYPNPNTGIMTVEISSDGSDKQMVNIEVVNMLGQVVYVASFAKDNAQVTATIHLPETLMSGVYMVRAGVDASHFSQKIISVSRN